MPLGRARGFGIALGGAFLVVAALALFLLRREPEQVSARINSSPPPEPAALPGAVVHRPATAAASVVQPEQNVKAKTGRSIRLRRPDGTTEIVDETLEMQLAREKRLEEAHARFLATQEAFHHRFEETLAKGGPAEAWSFLAPYLRAPKRTNEDEAEVYEAFHLAAEIQRELGRVSGKPSPFEGIRAPATTALAAFLADPEADASVRSIALGYLAGLPMNISGAGPEIVEVEGLETYDPETPPVISVFPEWPSAKVLLPAIGANPALKSAEMAGACLRILQDGSEPGWLRAGALRALGTSRDVREKLELPALAADGNREVREAAVDLLSLRPESVTPRLFFSLLESQEDPAWKRVLFERISSSSFGDPQMISVLSNALPKSPGKGYEDHPETFYRNTVLRLTLQQYRERKEAPLRDLLSGSLPGWASFEWKGSDSPLVTLAEFAAKNQLKEFAFPLKSVLGAIPAEPDRLRVQAALAQLAP